MCTITLPLFLFLFAAEPTTDTGRYFQIEVVDSQTKRGVPLVELRTVNHILTSPCL